MQPWTHLHGLQCDVVQALRACFDEAVEDAPTLSDRGFEQAPAVCEEIALLDIRHERHVAGRGGHAC